MLWSSKPLHRRDHEARPLGRLLHVVSKRWVFWAMINKAAYTPAVEYSTHVTSYLKEMASDRPQRPSFGHTSRRWRGDYRG